MVFRPSAQTVAVGLTLSAPAMGISLNCSDGTVYAVSGDSTREQVAISYNQVTATSPVLAGQYLVHSVPQMVSETLKIWVYGTTQTLVQSAYNTLRSAFETWNYQLHWTFGDYTETWNCNAASSITAEMGQGMLHNYMAAVTLSVPRYPTIITP